MRWYDHYFIRCYCFYVTLETSIKLFNDIKILSFCLQDKSLKVSILLIFPINQKHAPSFYQVVNLDFRNTQSEIDDRRTKNTSVCKLVWIKSVTSKKIEKLPKISCKLAKRRLSIWCVMTWGQFIGRNYYVSETRLCTL